MNDADNSSAPGGTRIGLALGGGGARGLAHILMLEACDELGVRPSVIAGTSIGSLIGAAYASGMSGAEIRDYCGAFLASRRTTIARLLGSGNGSLFWELWNPRKPALIDTKALLTVFLPEPLTGMRIDDLPTPLQVVAADFYAQSQYVMTSGPLLPALAASSALPGLLSPVKIGGRVLIDGGFVNPLPFDLLRGQADFTIAIDVSAGPQESARPVPTMVEAILGSMQITLRSIIREKLRAGRPDVLIKPKVGHYRVLDFLKFEALMAEAAPAKDSLKRAIETRIGSVSDRAKV